MKFEQLPTDIIDYIYEYDNTKHQLMKEVLNQLFPSHEYQYYNYDEMYEWLSPNETIEEYFGDADWGMCDDSTYWVRLSQ